MKIQYDPDFLSVLKKVNVIIRKNFKQRIAIFSKNSKDPRLNNHKLKNPYEGLRSIDINADWRAIYEEFEEGRIKIAYFIKLGTHKELYG